MITITEAAWNRLSTIQKKQPQISTFRLIYVDGKVKCGKGVRKDQDELFEKPGGPSLLLSARVANKLKQRTLDAAKDKTRPRLHLV